MPSIGVPSRHRSGGDPDRGPPTGRAAGARAAPWLLAAGAGVVVAIAWIGTADTAAGVLAVRVLQTCAALAFTVVAAVRSRREHRNGWAALAVFGLVWAANRAGAVIDGPDAPRGSMSGPLQALWVLGVPAAFVGLYLQCFGGLPVRNRLRVVSDAGVVVACWWFLAWLLFRMTGAGPDWRSELLIPAIEVAAAGLVVTAAVHQPHRRPLRWAAAALVAVVIGDGMVAHWDLTEPARAEPLLYAAFAASGLCALWFAAVPDSPSGAVELTNPRRRLLSVPMALVVVLGAVGVVARGGEDRVAVALLLLIIATAVVNYQLVFREIAESVGQLRASEAQFRTLFEHAPVGIVLSGSDGRITRANAAMSTLSGRPLEHVEGVSPLPLFDPEDRDHGVSVVRDVLAGRREHAALELRIRRPDGEERRADITVARLPGPEDARLVSVVQDVTERRRADAQLRYLAAHDQLTGLLNRPAFEARLAMTCRGATELRPPMAAVVDIDQFRVVNDTLGHSRGDRLLIACARRLEEYVGDRGRVARFGADEFGVLLQGASEADHRRQLDGLVRALAHPVDLGGGELAFPTVSAGGALWRSGSTAADLLAAADTAMHRAKERGRNRVEWFSDVDRQHVAVTHRLVQELHRAIDHDELVVHFQPFVDAAADRTVGAEALVRWAHPDRGLVPPGAFLPTAEASGLLVPLGELVLAASADHAARWNRPDGGPPRPPVAVSVNVSAQQLLDRSFPTTVDRILDRTGLEPGLLWLELTETTLMSDAVVIGGVLGELRGMGVRLAVDDFGTGYSSLTYLKRFPVEALKVDRSFVAGLGLDLEDTAIVGALVDLGHRLGLRIVAEGVETQLQREVLEELGCDLLQGFLLGRPEPVEVLEGRLVAEASAGPAPG